MADARPCREKGDLRERVSRVDEERWRAVRPLCCLERYVLCRFHFAGGRSMCGVLRPLRTNGPPGPHHHPDGAETRLLLPVVVCDTLALASFDGDARTSHRPSRCHHGSDAYSFPLGRRRNKLTATNIGRLLDRSILI